VHFYRELEQKATLLKETNIVNYQGHCPKKKSIKSNNHTKARQMQGGHSRRIEVAYGL